MRRLVAAAALALVATAITAAALLVRAPPASAQTTSPLMTVDAVQSSGVSVTVTGVEEGTATPVARTFEARSAGNISEARAIAAAEACHRALLLALAKPGQYRARVSFGTCTVALASP